MNQAAISALRDVCNLGFTSMTNKEYGGQQLQARTLTGDLSFQARYGMLRASQVISSGGVTTYDNTLDGQRWEWREFIGGNVRSRGNGGLSKFDCGLDPEMMKSKMKTKTITTERMYIHRNECMLRYIGSILQGGEMGAPNIIGNGDSLNQVAENTNLMDALMEYDMHEMIKEIDGTMLLGNWGYDQRTTDTPERKSASKYAHFDGFIKRTLQQMDATRYAAVEIDVPAQSGDGVYYIKYNGQFLQTASTVTELTAKINELRIDIKGSTPFNASNTSGNKITIVTGNPRLDAYGDNSLLVYYSSTGTRDKCDKPVLATILECKMAYVEDPLCFEFSSINNNNWFDYWRDVMKKMRGKTLDVYNEGNTNGTLGAHNVFIDPQLLIEGEFAVFEQLKTYENAERIIQGTNSILPRFIPVNRMTGTGLWFSSYSNNLGFFTNTSDPSLSDIMIDYDSRDQVVFSRNEALGNVLVADYNFCATNAKGSEFESNLTTPMTPQNLPHWAKEIRSDAIVVDYAKDTFDVRANVSYDATAGTLRLLDQSLTPSDDSVASYEWKVYFETLGSASPATQEKDTTVAVTQANRETIAYISLKVVLASGEEDTIIIPEEEIN